MSLEGFNPDWVSPPGATIQDWMNEQGVGKHELAVRLGLTLGGMEMLLEGTLGISYAMADKLAYVIGSSVDFWLNREDDYRRRPRRTES